MITEDFIQQVLNKVPQPVFFKRLHDIILSGSQYRVTSFIDLSPYTGIFPSLIEYAYGLKRSLCHYANIERYSSVNSGQPILYEEKSQTPSIHKILAECIEKVKLFSALVTNSHSQFIKILDLISDHYSRADEKNLKSQKDLCLAVSSNGSLED